jgi:hypothetical protein
MAENDPKAAVGRAKGGIARKEALSPERRKQIAADAAEARWGRVALAEHSGQITIGDLVIPCAVLPDGTRVLSERAITKAFGGKRGGAHWRRKRADDDGANLPIFLSAKNISSNISNELLKALTQPVLYRTKGQGGRTAHGLEASLLPKICRELRRLDREEKLHPSQAAVAAQAELIADGLTEVGIIGLVDEATGFQYVRAGDALAKILSEFIAKELQPYVPTFSTIYYSEIFRLRGLEYPKDTVQRPRYFGGITNEIVYERLAPGVLEELKRVTPKLPDGRHKDKLFRRLTQNKGYPALKEHLGAVETMMQLSNSWQDFMTKLDRLKPRLDLKSLGKAQQLSFDYDKATDSGKGL